MPYPEIIAISIGFHEDGCKVVGGNKSKAAQKYGGIYEQGWTSKRAAKPELPRLLQQDGVVA